MGLSEYLKDKAACKGVLVDNDIPNLTIEERYKLAKEISMEGNLLNKNWNLPNLKCFTFKEITKTLKSKKEHLVKQAKITSLYKKLAVKTLDFEL